MPDRSTPPVYTPPKTFPIPEAAVRTAGNGLSIHVISAGTLPVVKIELVFRAGTWFEQHPGNALFAIKMLGEGTSKRSSSDFSALFDQHGAFLELQSGPDYSSVVLYTVDRHLPTLVPVLAECLFEPTFPEHELSLLKAIRKQELAVKLEKNSFVAARLFRQQVFGESHPYGRHLQPETIEHQDREDLVVHHRDQLLGDFEIVASGLVDDSVIRLLFGHLGSVGHLAAKEFGKTSYVYHPQKLHQSSKNELQASIRVGKPFIDRQHPDYMACLLVNEILGGYFGSRLMQNIREEKGYTYGIYSNIAPYKNAAYFVIGTDVKQQHKDETLEEIYRELERLSTELVTLEELNIVKNYIKGSFLSSITTPFSLAEKIKNIRFYDLNYEFYHSFFDRLDALTAEDVLYAAGKHFAIGDMTQVVVG